MPVSGCEPQGPLSVGVWPCSALLNPPTDPPPCQPRLIAVLTITAVGDGNEKNKSEHKHPSSAYLEYEFNTPSRRSIGGT